MVEGGLSVDHVTIWRWVPRYAPILNQRLRRNGAIPIAPGVSMRPMSGLPATGQHYNLSHRPFVWTATADSILEKITRPQVLEKRLPAECCTPDNSSVLHVTPENSAGFHRNRHPVTVGAHTSLSRSMFC
jgi:hypothetical protein